MIADHFKLILSSATLPPADVSNAWPGQLIAQSSSTVGPVILDETNLRASGLAVLPESRFKEAMACEMSSLGFNLPATVKSRIWKGYCIDILSFTFCGR